MLHEKIVKLIPFMSENFISYPLWEEGKYIPFIGFWQKAETKAKCKELDKRLLKLIKKTGYEIAILPKYHPSVIHEYQIYPKFRDLKNGSYKFTKENWSLEEMVDMLIDFLNEKK